MGVIIDEAKADKNTNERANSGMIFKRLKRSFYYFWEPLPTPLKEALCWLLKASAFVVILTIAGIVVSYIYPDRSLELSWGDFKVSSNAAQRSADEAGRAEKQAKDALERITRVESVISNQRATIDSAFRDASDAKMISGIATQTLAEAKTNLDRMKSEADFLETISRAQTGYAEAYDSLTKILNGSSSDPRFAKAFNALEFIHDYHALWNSVLHKPPHFPARFGLSPEKLSSREFNAAFAAMNLNEQLEAVSFLSAKSSLSKQEKFDFLHYHSFSNANLRVRASAGKYYMDLAGFTSVNNPLHHSLISRHYLTNSLGTNMVSSKAN